MRHALHILAILFCYYVSINLITFWKYGSDKVRAELKLLRINEAELIGWAALGGWPSAMLAMTVFRHKTAKMRFQNRLRNAVIVNAAMLIAVIGTCAAKGITRIEKKDALLALRLVEPPLSVEAMVGGTMTQDPLLIAALGEDNAASTLAYMIYCHEFGPRKSLSKSELNAIRDQNRRSRSAQDWPSMIAILSKRNQLLNLWGLTSKQSSVLVSNQSDLEKLNHWLYQLHKQQFITFPARVSYSSSSSQMSSVPVSYSLPITD